RSYVDLAVNGAQRIERLLQDLLAYSRLAAVPAAEPAAADAGAALSAAIENLQTLIQDTKAGLEVTELPEVRIAPVHLIQLFQNLISNAIKYRGDDVPEIAISATRKLNEVEFAVRDNGIGIDPQYHHQIFGVFKRLHGKEYEGTGIGLALCHRIVERAGGRIWVESALGEGSTFFFTLPVV
ncbi:MAG: ATP-binding protein, partial [Bryobacteraceae bacterium]